MNLQALLRVGVMGGGRRGFSTGQATLSRIAVRRMLLQEGVNPRKKYQMNFGLPRVDDAAAFKVEGDKKRKKMPKHSSRLRNLNKVYLDKITDILSTGELASELYGYGLEVSEICVQPDMQSINVYWMTTGSSEKDDELAELLHSHAKTVRQELSNLRVIGYSPPLTFVRDDRHHKLMEVERLLTIADYGEDFEPTDPAHRLKASLPTLAMPLNTRIKATIEGLEGQGGQETKEVPLDPFEEALRIAASEPCTEDDATVVLPDNLPAIRHDVLGVNTSKIYNTVQLSMKRARAEHRRQAEAGSVDSLQDHHLQQTMNANSVNRKRDIQQWASQYKQMQKKEARKKNMEATLLSYPGNLNTQDSQDSEEVEVEWVEDYNDELE
ncbi:putative ribosome-binding factor A, mitochondrial [Chionoecetes opilio]|uniref:Putative ribosome-binding factor A, mitochondrial n=1 Tax=Chionoecetes opilio TaxID=41210 RepID=A0A8J4Y829_CHIOP|nr:putative ribosome-binding factor A, mitochondrial [Chionoecetes opilio]